MRKTPAIRQHSAKPQKAQETLSTKIHALLKQAFAYHQQAQFEPAEELYKQARKISPENFDTLRLLGGLYLQTNRHEQAKELLEKAIEINPIHAPTQIHLANALCSLGQYEQALSYFTAASNEINDHGETFFKAANYLHSLENPSLAMECLAQAIQRNQNYPEAFFLRGQILYQQRRLDQAISEFEKAINLKPDFADAFNYRGIALHGINRFDEAIANFSHAIALNPNFAEAYSNRGLTLLTVKRLEESQASLAQALRLNPNITCLMGTWIHNNMHICNWDDFETNLEQLSTRILHNETVCESFHLLALADDAALQRQLNGINVRLKCPENPSLGSITKRESHKKIRLAYFSADFHSHATAILMADFFELHDKEKFELIAFSFGPNINDGMRQRLQAAFDQFHEVSAKNDLEIAQLARSLEIDIAIDLKGLTTNNRTNIFAFRAAPIQVNYLGYPGTMGATYMDYLIADPTLIPPERQVDYSEKIVYLPHSYQVNDRRRQIADRHFTKAALGFPENGFVYCCFNNNYKITPETFDSWMRILHANGSSVLWLLEDNPVASRNLRKEAQLRGISADRLIFAPRMPLADHLARHVAADLFLDSFPCNAHTTASDALWAGLPVLTRMGNSFASRVAASLLNAIGLPELITTNSQAYEAAAIAFAQHPERLQALQVKLKSMRASAPLFDTPKITAHIENAYQKMMQRYEADLSPDHIYIEP